jgi:tRNA (guanosine-2'-O-)-methyltransferase
MSKGYFGIGIYNAKTPQNIGTLWRSAYVLGASFVFTVNNRYFPQRSDTPKSIRHMPLFHYSDIADLRRHLPENAAFVAIENISTATSLQQFSHPTRAVYLLGSETSGLPPEALRFADTTVAIATDTPISLNVSVAGSIVLWHRQAQRPSVD